VCFSIQPDFENENRHDSRDLHSITASVYAVSCNHLQSQNVLLLIHFLKARMSAVNLTNLPICAQMQQSFKYFLRTWRLFGGGGVGCSSQYVFNCTYCSWMHLRSSYIHVPSVRLQLLYVQLRRKVTISQLKGRVFCQPFETTDRASIVSPGRLLFWTFQCQVLLLFNVVFVCVCHPSSFNIWCSSVPFLLVNENWMHEE
jgi:hypothetical protein